MRCWTVQYSPKNTKFIEVKLHVICCRCRGQIFFSIGVCFFARHSLSSKLKVFIVAIGINKANRTGINGVGWFNVQRAWINPLVNNERASSVARIQRTLQTMNQNFTICWNNTRTAHSWECNIEYRKVKPDVGSVHHIEKMSREETKWIRSEFSL